MHVNRQHHRKSIDLTLEVTWEAQDGERRNAQVHARDVSDAGMRIDSPVAIGVTRRLFVLIPPLGESVEGKVRYCVPRGTCFQIGVQFAKATRLQAAPAVSTDYYEVLQVSPQADMDTIHRVYRIMAARYHPDNPDGGDCERFLQVSEAFRVIGDEDQRRRYDALRPTRTVRPLPVFQNRPFVDEKEGEVHRRLGVLCLLYCKRRQNPERPGISILDLEEMMSIPREYFEFTLWYLKEKGFVVFSEASDFALTAKGVDFVEEHTPAHAILDKLLPDVSARHPEPECATLAGLQ